VLPILAAIAAGCGSAAVHELPPAADAARAPALRTAPAGRVVAVGPAPEALAAGPGAHTFAVALRDGLAIVDARSGRVRERTAVPAAGTPAVFPVAAGALALGSATTAVVAGRTFVADGRAGAIAILEGGRQTARLLAGAQPRGLAAADFDARLAVVAGRARTLALYDPRTLRRTARAPAGVGPTQVLGFGDLLYVADTRGDGLLVFRTRPKLTLVRRVFLPGGPYGLALDPVRRRLWVTLTARNEVVQLPATGRPHPLLTLPTVRQPDGVAVDSALGTVAVTGRAAGVLQLIGAHEAYPEDEG
jgi:sugar lactone lactonase YvrE